MHHFELAGPPPSRKYVGLTALHSVVDPDRNVLVGLYTGRIHLQTANRRSPAKRIEDFLSGNSLLQPILDESYCLAIPVLFDRHQLGARYHLCAVPPVRVDKRDRQIDIGVLNELRAAL